MQIVVILHNLRSLYNVGSIFRTADAADVKKIYLVGITPAPVDQFGKVRPQIAKVALGAERTVAWEKLKNTAVLIKKLRKEKYKIYAIEQAKNSIPYYKLKANSSKLKTALTLGAEVEGLPPSILKLCDKILEIPMHGRKESLNVSVAFGIAVYNLLRK